MTAKQEFKKKKKKVEESNAEKESDVVNLAEVDVNRDYLSSTMCY